MTLKPHVYMKIPFARFFIFLVLFISVNASLIQKIRHLFATTLPNNLSENAKTTESSLSIILVKRDVADTIAKRSAKGIDIEKSINQPNSTNRICSDDQLMVYLAEVQAINPESIINISTMDEVFLMCRQVGESLDKMGAFLKTCRIVDNRNLYLQLIRGVDKLYDLLCEKDSKFKAEFQNHFPCIKQLHDDFETCFGPPDWIEDGDKKDVCLAYKDIADCYYTKTSKVCGVKAAKIMRTLVTSIVNAITPVHCSVIALTKKSPSEEIKSKSIIVYTNKYIILTLYIVKQLLL